MLLSKPYSASCSTRELPTSRTPRTYTRTARRDHESERPQPRVDSSVRPSHAQSISDDTSPRSAKSMCSLAVGSSPAGRLLPLSREGTRRRRLPGGVSPSSNPTGCWGRAPARSSPALRASAARAGGRGSRADPRGTTRASARGGGPRGRNREIPEWFRGAGRGSCEGGADGIFRPSSKIVCARYFSQSPVDGRRPTGNSARPRGHVSPSEKEELASSRPVQITSARRTLRDTGLMVVTQIE